LPRQVARPFRAKRFGRTPYERAVSSLDSRLAALLEAAGPNTLTVLTGDHGEKTADEQYLPGTAVYEAARLYGADRAPLLARLGLERLAARIGDEALFDIYLRIWAGMLRLHLLAGHVVHVYDFLVRVPLVLHWPGGLRGGVASDRMVRQVDIAATLLDLLGI